MTYTPSILGPESATLFIADNSPGTPQSVPLTGTGVPQATVLPAGTTFPKTKVGTTSAPRKITLRNNLPSTLTGVSYSATGPFGVSSSTCSSTLSSKTGCTISVTFTPTTTGLVSGSLTIVDSANNSPQVVKLSGTGD